MIALSSVRNLEFGSFFGEVLSISGSRTQISLPLKFIFCRPKLKYGSWTNASFKSKVAVPPLLVTAAEVEAKVVLHKFLREQGFSSAIAKTTINRSDLFVEHLVSRLYSLQNGRPVGHEFTATEIREALIPYLESLLEDYGSSLIGFLENFPNSTAKGLPVAFISSANSINSKKLNALSRVTGTGPDGQLPPHILYLLELGMDLEQINRIVCRYPGFACLSLDGQVRPWTEFLLSLGLSNLEISGTLIRMPRLFSYSLSEKAIPMMQFLENLGLNKRQFGRILCRFPLFIVRRKKRIEATVDFLYEMGISAESAGRIFVHFPQLVCLSVENNLGPTVEYFRSLGARVDVMMLRCPQVFAHNTEGHLKGTTEFFLAQGYSKEEIGCMVTSWGCLYAMSLSKNLIPKWEFFLTMNYSKEELVKFPQYFGYSFERRIKPRYAAVKAAGVEFSLNTMLALPDAKFAKSLKKKIVVQGLKCDDWEVIERGKKSEAEGAATW